MAPTIKINHSTIKIPGQKLFAVVDWNADHTISFSQSSTSTDGYLSSTDWNIFNNKVSSQWTTSGTSIYYNSGKVGIGTDNPIGNINVAGSELTDTAIFERPGQTTDSLFAGARVLARKTTNMGDGFGSAVQFTIMDDTSANPQSLALIGAVRNGADSTGDIIFKPYITGTATEKMRLTYDGKLGIGTNNPLYGIHLKASGPVIYLEDSDSTTRTYISNGTVGTESDNKLNLVAKDEVVAICTNVTKHFLLGGSTDTTSGLLNLQGTTGALILTRLTTTQRNALTAVNGMLIYNTTDNKFQGYENGSWTNLI